MKIERESPGARSAFLLLLALVLWLPIPNGSNSPWAIAIFGILVGATLLLWTIQALFSRVRVPPTLKENKWVLALWVLWLTWITCQLVPIPAEKLQHYSPKAAAEYMKNFGEGGANPLPPTSVQPAVTYSHLLESLSYFGLYLLVLLTVSGRKRLAILAGTIVLSGLAQAVYGGVMTLSGLEYGFLQKKTAYLGFATGTFVNRNHLAGYIEICAAIGIGLVVADIRPGSTAASWKIWFRDAAGLLLSRRLRMRVFVAVMVIALVLTRSRGGNFAFFAALLLCGGLYLMARERRLFTKAALLLGSIVIIDLFIVGHWFGVDRVVERVGQTTLATETRAEMFPELVKAFESYWLTGSGLGTFGIAVLPFREADPRRFYDHAHNDYAQFLIETGIIGSTLLLMLVLVTAVHALRVMVGRRDRMRAGLALGGLMGMTAIAIHSAVDFNLQIPANAATIVVVMAMINSCSHRSSRLASRSRKASLTSATEVPD